MSLGFGYRAPRQPETYGVSRVPGRENLEVRLVFQP